jgi:hypothetical protein
MWPCVSVSLVTAPVAPMWCLSQMSSFLLVLIWICLTLESDSSGDLGRSDSDAKVVEVS